MKRVDLAPSGTAAARLDRVKAIVGRALAGHRVTVYLFGSWASGSPRPTSDVDVAIDPLEPLPLATLANLREALEESTIPFRVDVVDLSQADAAFRERVRREGVVWIDSASA